VTWFDALVALLVVAFFVFEMRQEAGRALMDTVATLAALHLAREYAPLLTAALGAAPLPGSQTSPALYGACFGLFWVIGLAVSYQLHCLTRWSFDHVDPVFGALFGIVVGVSVGHVFTDVTARLAVMHYGFLPDYMQNSWVGAELRSFRSYHYVLDVFHAHQNGH
jgi:uncharacterized membrane protein required for colicin V production